MTKKSTRAYPLTRVHLLPLDSCENKASDVPCIYCGTTANEAASLNQSPHYFIDIAENYTKKFASDMGTFLCIHIAH